MERRRFLGGLLGLSFLALLKPQKEQPKTDSHLHEQLIGCIVGQNGKCEYIYGHYDWINLHSYGLISDKTLKEEIL